MDIYILVIESRTVTDSGTSRCYKNSRLTPPEHTRECSVEVPGFNLSMDTSDVFRRRMLVSVKLGVFKRPRKTRGHECLGAFTGTEFMVGGEDTKFES